MIMGKDYIHRLEGKFANKILPDGKEPIQITYLELGRLYPRLLRRKWSRENWHKGRDKLQRRLKRTHEFFKSFEF